MPSTINGIGTTYYGRSNSDRHPGVCEHCHQAGTLESYDTRLWFVVLFIPIVPLGRKRILDYCPSCTHHRALPIDEWVRMRDKAIQEGTQEVSAAPNDPKAAVKMHASLDFFGKKAEAEKMAGMMAEQFAADPEVLLHLAGWHERARRGAEADALCEKALAAAPENPAARRAVGVGCLQRGDLARARELLAGCLEPGPGQDPAVAVMMAKAYQNKKEHEEALKLFAKALGGAPALARDAGVRKAVRASEKALGRKSGLLPFSPREFALRWGLPSAAIAAVALVLFANYYCARHQSLHVLNGTKLAATVSLDGTQELPVGPRQRRILSMAEGQHSILVKLPGQPDETVEFTAQQGWFERFGNKTAFLFNIKGAAAILREQAVYVPEGQPGQAGSQSLLCGKSFVDLRDLDYVFSPFPEQISVEQKSGQVIKTRLTVGLGEPATVLRSLIGQASEDKLLSYAEIHLDLDGADLELLRDYLDMTTVFGKLDRARNFLEKGLERRPLVIEWHRLYQTVCERTGKDQGLLGRYDRMLAADPGSSGLLYLRGRVEPRSDKAMDFYRRSAAADAKNPYPRMAMAFQLLSRGEPDEARPLAEEAGRLDPKDGNIAQLIRNIRLALGEHAALRAEAQAEAQKRPLDLGVQLELLELCAAVGDLSGAAEAHDAYCRKIFGRFGVSPPKAGKIGSPAQYLNALRAKPNGREAGGAAAASWLALLYLRGDLEAWLKDSTVMVSDTEKTLHGVQVNLELGRPAEAEKLLIGMKLDNAYLELMMSIAWRRAGDAAKAAGRRANAVKLLASGRPEERLAGELLSRGEALDLKALDDLTLDAAQKAVILAALADTCPAKKSELLALCRKLNFGMWFPHRFLEQAADGK